MINRKYKCIFVEVPKTGSTSIRGILGYPPKAHLDLKELEQLTNEHLPFMDMRGYNILNSIYSKVVFRKNKERIGRQVWDSYYKFGFVRNPWSRTVSLYLREQGIQMRDKMTFTEFVEWIEYSTDTCVHPSKKISQLDWFKDKNGQIAADFIGRFENLQSDWEIVSKKLNITENLPHLNKNEKPERKHYTEYYNQQTRELIQRKFREDIEHFEYDFYA